MTEQTAIDKRQIKQLRREIVEYNRVLLVLKDNLDQSIRVIEHGKEDKKEQKKDDKA